MRWALHQFLVHPVCGVVWALADLVARGCNLLHDATRPEGDVHADAQGRHPEAGVRWLVHNVIGHPVFAVLMMLGREQAAEDFHWWTIPKEIKKR